MTTPAESDALADSRPANTALRLVGGVVITACLVGLLVADRLIGGRALFTVLLAGLVAVGLWEFYGLAARAGARPAAGFGIACGVALVAAQWFREQCAAAGIVLPIDPVAAVAASALFGAVAIQVARSGVQGAWANLGATVLGLALVWFPTVFVARIRGFGLGPLLMFVATVKVSDVAAYVVGRAVGRRRLAPRVSPNKTVAGAVGALVAGTLTALAFCVVWPAACAGLSLGAAVLFGAVVTVFGMLGDLGESVLKRAAGAKDASNLLPGFGGVLDVLDSVWGAAPAAYVAFVLLGTPPVGLVVL